ncbi:phospholipase A and acyltransferase 2-like [Antedon mediterranea]|uniref:phospholipase A and acyltransferase 2-like n=1 Tax=Antedon mediterranea TaxID=105859 RepID=UPI003AF89376
MSRSKFQAGDLVKVRRWDPIPYSHWGVYIGNGEVMHLSGAEFNIKAKETAKVHRVTFKEFVGDDDNAEVECIPCPSDVSREEVVRLAKSAEGGFFRNRPYDLFTNNCEHFARWCHGEARSKQVDNAVWWGTVGAAAVGGALLLGSLLSSDKEDKRKNKY